MPPFIMVPCIMPPPIIPGDAGASLDAAEDARDERLCAQPARKVAMAAMNDGRFMYQTVPRSST
jgi:hypothetical protein